MSGVNFEWDENKNRLNIQGHGVSFEEAISVFYDEYGLLLPDPDHSADEDRFLLLGLSESLRLMVVCHCYRMSDTIIRIISARKATKEETRQYMNNTR